MVKGINLNKNIEEYKKTLSKAELQAFNALSREEQISIMKANYSGKVPSGSLWSGSAHSAAGTTDTTLSIVDSLYNDVKGLGTSSTFGEHLGKITPENIADVFELYNKKYGESLVSAISNEFNISKKDRTQLLAALGEKLNKKLEDIDAPRRIDLTKLNELSNKTLSSWRTCDTGEIDNLFAENLIPVEAEKYLPTPSEYTKAMQHNSNGGDFTRCFQFPDGTAKMVKYTDGNWTSRTLRRITDPKTHGEIRQERESYLNEPGKYEEHEHSESGTKVSKYENNICIETKVIQKEPVSFRSTTQYDPKSGEILSKNTTYSSPSRTINEFYENNKLIKLIDYSSGEDGGVRTDTFYNENGDIKFSRRIASKVNTNQNSSEITLFRDGKAYKFTSSVSEPDENGIIHSECNGKHFQTKFSDDTVTVENLTDGKTTSLDLNKLFKECTDEEKKEFIEKLKSVNGQVLFDIAAEVDDIEHSNKSLYINTRNLIFKVFSENHRIGGAYSAFTNDIFVTENTLEHELGHALDATISEDKLPLQIARFSSNKNEKFQQAFEKELENFEKIAEEKNIDKPYATKTSLEFIAESYAMLMTGDSQADGGLTMLEYFPESFIEAAKHIEWVRTLPANKRK